MIVKGLKECGITKDEIQRNVDFVFLSEEEQNAEIHKKLDEFLDKLKKGLKEKLEGDE